MVAAGAPVLSVVTEFERFGGSIPLFESIRNAAKVPLLRKDFITTEDEIKRSVDIGASAVLLICANLSESLLQTLYEAALKHGIEPFVEAHLLSEIAVANKLNAALIGVNNRDITSFEVDGGGVAHSINLLQKVNKNAVKVSESGIFTRENVLSVRAAGADAALVGTAIWQSRDVAEGYKTLNGGYLEK